MNKHFENEQTNKQSTSEKKESLHCATKYATLKHQDDACNVSFLPVAVGPGL